VDESLAAGGDACESACATRQLGLDFISESIESGLDRLYLLSELP